MSGIGGGGSRAIDYVTTTYISSSSDNESYREPRLIRPTAQTRGKKNSKKNSELLDFFHFLSLRPIYYTPKGVYIRTRASAGFIIITLNSIIYELCRQ